MFTSGALIFGGTNFHEFRRFREIKYLRKKLKPTIRENKYPRKMFERLFAKIKSAKYIFINLSQHSVMGKYRDNLKQKKKLMLNLLRYLLRFSKINTKGKQMTLVTLAKNRQLHFICVVHKNSFVEAFALLYNLVQCVYQQD